MRVKQENDTAIIISRGYIPNYEILETDYHGWIEPYLKSQKIQDKIPQLFAEFHQIKALPVSNAEFLLRCKTSHAALQERAVERLRRYLCGSSFLHVNDTDPFINFETYFPSWDETPFVPPWSDVEAAIKNRPDNGISAVQRKKNLEKINSQIASLTAELREYSPAIYCTWSGDKIISDIRHEFVEFWQDIQEQLNAPAGPRALELSASSVAEQNAWEKLGMAAFVNPNGIKPNPAD